MELRKKQLAGWAGAVHASCFQVPVGSESDCREVIEYARKNGHSICCRAGANSFGDSILNKDNIVIDLKPFDRILAWDPEKGVMVVEPGVTFGNALRKAMPDGWVVACAPGGLKVTMGGALGFNVHGKDGVHNGNFGDHVRSFDLITADGEVRTITSEKEAEIFNAVVGGMGLLGVVTKIEMQLIKIPSANLIVEKNITRSIRESLAYLDHEDTYDYAIGWIDPFAPGESVGRGYMTRAKWSPKPYEAGEIELEAALKGNTRIFGLVNSGIFWKIIGPIFRPAVLRWVNRLHYALAQVLFGKSHQKEMLFPKYLYIQESFPNVNDVFKPYGLVTVQPIIPRAAGHDAVVKLLHLCQDLGVESLMAGIKRRRPDDRFLSFADDAYSFSIQLQLRGRRIDELNQALDRVFQFVIEVGGRVYLAKDDRLPEKYFKKMYPLHEKFWEVKKRLDPNQLFMSDQARRVFGL